MIIAKFVKLFGEQAQEVLENIEKAPVASGALEKVLKRSIDKLILA